MLEIELSYLILSYNPIQSRTCYKLMTQSVEFIMRVN